MEKRPNQQRDETHDGLRKIEKKAYVPLRLLEYGSVAKLTQSAGGTGGDGMSEMQCL